MSVIRSVFSPRLFRKRKLTLGTLFLLSLWFLLTGSRTRQLLPQPAPSIAPAVSVSPVPSPASASESAIQVVRIIDGDTIEVSGGQTVRYIGIDTPETRDPRRGMQCYGKEAAAKNADLVAGAEIRLEKDVSETDQYGRLLRYVYRGDLMINEYLVREGYAKASRYPPDVKYAERFRDAEREARDQRKGLWGDACTAR